MVLKDEHRRPVTGIRESLTDRWNFDCVSCHNEELGDTRRPSEPQDGKMSASDVIRILEAVAGFGVDAVKFTGGEPIFAKAWKRLSAVSPRI